jgi:hypothetical protein
MYPDAELPAFSSPFEDLDLEVDTDRSSRLVAREEVVVRESKEQRRLAHLPKLSQS